MAFISKFLVVVRTRMELEVSSQFLSRISFMLQLVSLKAIHCNRRCVCTEHPHTAHFSCTHFILAHMHRMAQGVARRVFRKERSSTCHHVSDCALSLHPLTFSSLSLECLYNFSHFFISSFLVIILHVVETAEQYNPCDDPQNEEHGSVAIHNPLLQVMSPT